MNETLAYKHGLHCLSPEALSVEDRWPQWNRRSKSAGYSPLVTWPGPVGFGVQLCNVSLGNHVNAAGSLHKTVVVLVHHADGFVASGLLD